MKWILILVFIAVSLFATVDINSANIKELSSLKGIGPKKAESIVSFRKKHCFTKVEDITKVKGVGKKTLEKNRNNMTAGTCKQ